MEGIKLSAIAGIIVAMLAISGIASAASVDYFLKIDGIDGEALTEGCSQHRGMENFCSINSFEYGVSLLVDPVSGLATGKRQHKPFVITKELDKSSPKLFEALVSGRHLESTEIRVLTLGPDGREPVFYKFELGGVLVTSIDQSGQASEKPTESVSFNFEKIKMTYVPDNIVAEDDLTPR